ncbi:MAG: type II toxin-antitoxin system RelE/ParE family toxin [Candidatus Competibacteraceae bacterium]|jgi:mRNA interferase RelE/StbE|nr:type II toxin-antitoxin system RelE/ParE family toxin [Candidatus Competibacteraceae bacterium]
MPWQLVMTRAAEKDLGRLPRADQEAVLKALEQLIVNPATVDIRKLKGHIGQWRLRVGQWRARFTFDPPSHTITVLRVLHRSIAYR